MKDRFYFEYHVLHMYNHLLSLPNIYQSTHALRQNEKIKVHRASDRSIVVVRSIFAHKTIRMTAAAAVKGNTLCDDFVTYLHSLCVLFSLYIIYRDALTHLKKYFSV